MQKQKISNENRKSFYMNFAIIIHWTTNFFEKRVYHNTMMFFYVFGGADFENDIENSVVSMVLPLFKVI